MATQEKRPIDEKNECLDCSGCRFRDRRFHDNLNHYNGCTVCHHERAEHEIQPRWEHPDAK